MLNNGFSLLYPRDASALNSIKIDSDAMRDLELDKLVDILAKFKTENNKLLKNELITIFSNPPVQVEVIRYRQAVFSDIMENKALKRGFDEILPLLQVLNSAKSVRNMPKFKEAITRVHELNSYVSVMVKLNAIFNDPKVVLKSEGLLALKKMIITIGSEPAYIQMVEQLPELIVKLRGARSVAIGVNLDDLMRPIEATLLSVNTELYSDNSASFFGNIFGSNSSEFSGIAALHSSQRQKMIAYEVIQPDPLLIPLFADLFNILEKIANPVLKLLEKFMAIDVTSLGQMGNDLTFYLSAADLFQCLKDQGLPVCKPDIKAIEERSLFVENSYNLNLVFHLSNFLNSTINGSIVCNDIQFDTKARIYILTGPNRGGKTTYTQSIAIIQLLFQLGLYVPGQSAVLSPVDALLTHFPVEENSGSNLGRFGNEAKKLRLILESASDKSMIFLNEALTGTSESEGSWIAADILRIMRYIGVRAVFATHMHDLALKIDELNAYPGTSLIDSLISVLAEESNGDDKNNRRTYKIVKGRPTGNSNAVEIARKHGIGLDQLKDMVDLRRIIN